ncbi:MAG: response regulator transcription factor [Anaerolinea sp.]|nr:response regulator transcription factor [Anaerolinea sp.]
MGSIQLIVVSTNALIRSGIQQVVAQSDVPIQVVGMFAYFSEVHKFLNDSHATVLLVDDSLPRSTNLAQEVKQMMERHSGLAVLMLAQRPTASLIRLLLDHGVSGMIHKDDDLEHDLNQAIRLTSLRGVYLSPTISRLLDMQHPLPKRIHQRDIDVLQLLADGFQIKEISAHLGLNRKSVYRSLRTMRTVYDAQSNAQLIDIAHQSKLLDSAREE